MRKELKFIFIVFLLSIFSVNAHAAKRYWVGATSNSWKLKANWSSSSGGAGGSTIPGSSDTAFFDGSATSHHRCDIDSTVNIKRLSMTGDTLSQGANTITIGSTGATLSGGVFLGGSSDITVSGTFTISGNTFTSTSGTFSTSANLTISSGSFTHNSGTLSLTASSTLTISRTGGVTFYNLSFAPAATSTYTITSTTAINVSHLLSYDGSSAITVNTGNINAKGDISITNTSTSGNGTATITINGSGTQTITGTSTIAQGKLPNIVINKSSSDTLKLVNTISVIGNWTYTAGKISEGTSTVYFANVLTITGTHSLYNVIFAGTTFTIASGTTLTVKGTLTTRGVGPCVINTGTINAKGDIKISNTSSAGGGTASLNINGTGNQAFTGNSVAGYGPLCKVDINKSSGTLTLDSIISLAGGWTYTAGAISAGTSTVAFYDNSQTVTGSHTLNNVTFYSSTANYTYTVASGTTLTVNGTLTIDGTSGVSINTGTINAKKDITILNSSSNTTGNGSVVINGTGTQTITGLASFTQARLPNVTINKSSSDTLKLVNTVSVLGNWTYTAGVISAGTSIVNFQTSKTISGTHTLNDIRFGANSTYTIASGTTLTVNGTLTYGNSSTGPIIVNTGTINAKGDISLDNPVTGGGGTASIVINGTGTQTMTGNSTDGASALPNLTINKSAGKLNLANTISAAKDWTYTAGTIDPGSSTVYFITTKTITGSHTLYNVTFDGSAASTYTIVSGTTLTASGKITINGSNAITLNTGTINAGADIAVTNTATGATGTASLVINGTGTQTLTGSGTAGQGRLPAITVNKTTGELDLASIISIYGGWTQTKGKVDAHTNTTTVDLYGNFNLDALGSDGNVNFYNLTIAANTTTLTGDLVVSNNITINSTTTLSAATYAITVGGNWSDNGTWTYSTSSVTFNGTGINTIAKSSGTETFYDLGFNRNGKYQKLNNPVTVNHVLTLTRGHVISDTINYLLLIDNATLTGGGDSAYVHGPVRKTGNDAFTFPLGDTTLVDTAYHPLAMTAPSSTSDQFEAIYHAVKYTVGDSLVDSLSSVNQNEYWTCERKAGSSNITVTLGWNKNSDMNDIGSLRVAAWNGTKWLDYGQGGLTINWPKGNITASTAFTFSTNPIVIVIGVRRISYSGYATLKRKLDGGFYEAKSNSLYFKFDDEYNDQTNMNLSYRVINASNVNQNLLSSTNNSALSKYGDNRFRLDLYNTSSTALASGYYILEVTNEKEEKFYLRFHKS